MRQIRGSQHYRGELLSVFDATGDNAAEWKPSYSVAPTDPAPVVREWFHDEAVHRDVDSASWGLKPGWAKPGGPAPINARLESVASNGMFRSAFASQRCLVPMAGYYEWQQMGDGKQPYFIHGDGDVLAAVGLYAAHGALSFRPMCQVGHICPSIDICSN